MVARLASFLNSRDNGAAARVEHSPIRERVAGEGVGIEELDDSQLAAKFAGEELASDDESVAAVVAFTANDSDSLFAERGEGFTKEIDDAACRHFPSG